MVHSGLRHAVNALRKALNRDGRNFRVGYTAKTGIGGEVHCGSSRTRRPSASGTLPLADGAAEFRGRIGDQLSIEAGRSAARLAALNALALARQHLGSLDKVTRVVRLTVSLATTSEFRDHAKVADGASELLAEVFGKEKASTRMVSGVMSLPAGVCVVVEVILAIDSAA